MKAWQIGAFGLEHLESTELPEPQPGPGELLIEVRAASLNYRDLLMVRGHYDPRVPLPLVPCSDAVGVVIGHGEGASLPLGTRVCAAFAPSWLEGPPHASHLKETLGGPRPGVLRERLVVSERAVVPVAAHLSDEQAATLPCAGVTAYNALQAARIQAGSSLLTLGTGGVSIFALQLAVARGATVFSTSSSASKRARVLELGAAEALDYTTDASWGRTVAGLAGEGVDGVVEVGGVGTLTQSLRACRAGGTVALIGVLAGDRQPVSLTRALMYGIRIQGIMVGSVADLRSLMDEVTAHRIEPIVDRCFGFDEVPRAFQWLEGGAHLGKVVIRA